MHFNMENNMAQVNSEAIQNLYLLGRSLTDVADELNISVGTVRYHFAKLQNKGVRPMSVLELANVIFWPGKTLHEVKAIIKPLDDDLY
jgi:orotate phosphoribosyltransferase-like protein